MGNGLAPRMTRFGDLWPDWLRRREWQVWGG